MTANHVLDQEAILRELELDEERRAGRMRAEVASHLALPARKRVHRRTRHLLVLQKDGRALAAKCLLDWWKKRSAHGGVAARAVSTNEINRLAGIIRRLE